MFDDTYEDTIDNKFQDYLEKDRSFDEWLYGGKLTPEEEKLLQAVMSRK